MSLRIAMLGACPYPAPQGSQVLLKNTALVAESLGHEVHVVVYGYGIGPDESGLTIHRAAPIPGARRIAAGPSPMKPLLDLALLLKLREVIRRHRIDFIHAHNYEALIVALAAHACPVVYHAHNVMQDELPHFLYGGRVVGAWLDRTFPLRADRVIALHERLAQCLIANGCAPERVAVIPPSIEPDAFLADAPQETRPLVLYAGNLDRYQNLPLLLRAMSLVRQTMPDARLVIASAQRGRRPGAEMLHTPDFASLKSILARDCVVACPRVSWSGYPIKLLNCMAAGKAVVACRSAAPPVVHEENGLLVPDNDVGAFAEALLRLLRDADLRARLGGNARETIRLHHEPRLIASQIETVYQMVSTKGLPR
ncbi:MAG TPA: glycosyltransferase family 4 protein [Candidatus Hydrogenedentes bacterium]|nr:glycosyltransferase family 4 protein [Candidatus Hydrogenedentota bacterium]HRT19273.1 glycosyltransferase family 4 protein [Candidatus Hydrogenedentota bacterium]HRT63353.1 glycosyltransferase family 4 protein [Candidatus Hydrogenedentota bacterium]